MPNDTTDGDADQHGQQGAGATQSGGNPARSGDDDKPITKKELKALLGDFGKSLDTRVNRAVTAQLRRQPKQPPVTSTSDDDGDLDDADLDSDETDTQDGSDGTSHRDRKASSSKPAPKPAKSKELKRIADLERKLAEKDAKDAANAKKTRVAELMALVAPKTAKPKLVAKLLEAQLEVGEDGQFVAKDDDGEPIDLEDYVETFLRENPEFVKRGKDPGGDVVPEANGGSGDQKFDFDNPSADGLNAILRTRSARK